MIFYKTVFFLALSLFTTFLPAQRLVFDAYLGDDFIGTMIVTRTEGPNGITYTSVTDLTVKYIISVDLDLSYAAKYENGQLVNTSFKYQRSHKTREACHGKLSGNRFVTYFEDRTERVDVNAINQSLMASYFREPTNSQQVFSERWGVNIPLEHLGNQQYKIELPDGKESYMTYADGWCKESRIVSGWGTIVFRRS